MRTPAKTPVATPLLLAAIALVAACRVSSNDIEAWKGTAKGPGKLLAVLQAPKYEIDLRTRAALALIEMERQDVDGSAELQKSLRKLDEKTRQQIVSTMAPALEKLMNGEGAAAPGPDAGTGDGPTPLQIRAKDAGYLLLGQADPDTRKRLTDAVVAWYALDFNGRSLLGNYSAEQVIRSLGAPGAVKLVDGLNEKLPGATIIKSAELISQIGDAETKARAAARLVEIERAMEAQPFLDWVKQGVRTQLTGTGVGPDGKPIKVDEARIQAAANLNRANFILQGALPALKHFADLSVVAERLIQLAEAKGESQEITDRRRSALAALQGKATRAQLKRLQSLALDGQAPPEVRDEAFDRLAEIGSAEIVPALWPLVQSSKDDRLRWRAGELVLTVGGKSIVGEFLSRLPADKDIKYASGELTGYATRLSQMADPPMGLIREKLSSDRWWERVIAIQFLGRKGTAADAAALQPLTEDAATVAGDGWPKDTTVGAVAKEVIETLKAKAAEGSST